MFRGANREDIDRARAVEGHIDEDGLTEKERLDWLYMHTRWAGDFDETTHARTILSIWEATKIPNQQWRIWCKRRRISNRIARNHTIEVMTLERFPSREELEIIVESIGFGGGEYRISNMKGRKRTHRVHIEGPPLDPLVSSGDAWQEARGKEQPDAIKDEMLRYAIQHIRQDPALMREVGLRMAAKEFGISIPRPDPRAPVPFGDLPEDLQDWLDEHPDDKDAYMRRLLGLKTPRVEPTFEQRAAEALGDRFIEHLASEFENQLSGPSEWERVLQDLLGSTTLDKVVETFAGLHRMDSAHHTGEPAGSETSQPPQPADPRGFNLRVV